MRKLLGVLAQPLTMSKMAQNFRRYRSSFPRRAPSRNSEAKAPKAKIFADLLRIEVEGGRGGSGCYSAVRTRSRKTGGWNGGNGGAGGDVLVEAADMDSNLGMKKVSLFEGNQGNFGRAKLRSGEKAKPIRIFVPCGTAVTHVFKDASTGREVLKEIAFLSLKGQSVVAARGGRGGRGTGDARFSEDKQAGAKGERRVVDLSLSIPHHISLLGFSGAGKSTLLSALTNVGPPRRDTCEPTSYPKAGCMKFIDEKGVTLLDFPPFAPSGGEVRVGEFKWKKHLRSSRVMLFVIDSASPAFFGEVQAQLQFVRDNDLLKRKLYFAANKIDAADAQRQRLIHRFFTDLGLAYSCLSLETTLGLNKLAADLRGIFFNAKT